MKFVEIQGANLTLAEDQPEFETIRVRRQPQPVMLPDGTVNYYMGMTLELKPTREEIEHIREGGSLFVNVLAMHWPPLSVTTHDPTLITATEGNA